MAAEVLFSADAGWHQKVLFRFTNLGAGYPKSGSILTAWEPLAIYPRVKANRPLMGLGCSFFKGRITKNFFIL